MQRGAAFATFLLTAALVAQQPPEHQPAPGLQRWKDRSFVYMLDLPQDWRQATPDETRQLREVLPKDAHQTQPSSLYVLGPVEAWLSGKFDGRFLQVVLQDGEWETKDQDLPARLQEMWRQFGTSTGLHHEIDGVAQTVVGEGKYAAIECQRTSTKEAGGPALRSLDIYLPTGGRQLTLSFRCRSEDFAANLPQFRTWLATLLLNKRAQGEKTVGDRRWTPLLAGGGVGLVLMLLYRHRRRERQKGMV